MNKLKIQYQITQDNTFMHVLHEALGGDLLNENELILPPNHPIASGRFVRYTIRDIIRVLIVDNMYVKKPIILERLPDPNNDFLAINIYMSDAPFVQQVGAESKIVARLNEGLFFNSSNLSFIQDIPSGERYTLINLTFSKEKIRAYLNPPKGDFFSKILKSTKKYAVYETLTSGLLQLAEQIMTLDMSQALNKMTLESRVLDFTYHALKKLETRNLASILSSLSQEDVNAVYETRKFLLSDLSNPPAISVLAKKAAMSESKLKTCFKQIYGNSIYQHFLDYRMEKAYKIIEKKQHSINEVSTMLGYTNPSQFSKKFKDHFNFLPNDVVKFTNN